MQTKSDGPLITIGLSVGQQHLHAGIGMGEVDARKLGGVVRILVGDELEALVPVARGQPIDTGLAESAIPVVEENGPCGHLKKISSSSAADKPGARQDRAAGVDRRNGTDDPIA